MATVTSITRWPQQSQLLGRKLVQVQTTYITTYHLHLLLCTCMCCAQAATETGKLSQTLYRIPGVASPVVPCDSWHVELSRVVAAGKWEMETAHQMALCALLPPLPDVAATAAVILVQLLRFAGTPQGGRHGPHSPPPCSPFSSLCAPSSVQNWRRLPRKAGSCHGSSDHDRRPLTMTACQFQSNSFSRAGVCLQDGSTLFILNTKARPAWHVAAAAAGLSPLPPVANYYFVDRVVPEGRSRLKLHPRGATPWLVDAIEPSFVPPVAA